MVLERPLIPMAADQRETLADMRTVLIVGTLLVLLVIPALLSWREHLRGQTLKPAEGSDPKVFFVRIVLLGRVGYPCPPVYRGRGRHGRGA